jgi:hypothetical protein
MNNPTGRTVVRLVRYVSITGEVAWIPTEQAEARYRIELGLFCVLGGLHRPWIDRAPPRSMGL